MAKNLLLFFFFNFIKSSSGVLFASFLAIYECYNINFHIYHVTYVYWYIAIIPIHCFSIYFQGLTFPTSLGYTLISGIYGVVVTSQNGGDKA